MFQTIEKGDSISMFMKIGLFFLFTQDSGQDCIVVDDWIVFRASPRIARLVKVRLECATFSSD